MVTTITFPDNTMTRIPVFNINITQAAVDKVLVHARDHSANLELDLDYLLNYIDPDAINNSLAAHNYHPQDQS
ncbi:Glucan endo-1,3-alpha-glucosidase agn1 [Podospora bellae-mahoneyi]|uniref:Glucan endo-1,3-alpha-glucosidase agn1 n=1 Tax=Podospora bellae-mahoneyi TaxID=2093777 RepID=A0ABR0FCK0_9PEZI|nr:Glucan endo-1,3-alpha-glucosidase agn1 [Podospora bellae-mahoneyi]